MTARVFVPLVGADGSGQQLFEAIAGATAPEAHPAKLSPQISELYDFGLYRIGQTVREAVTRFADQRRAKVWLGRANARLAPWYLRISELQVGRLSDENARSAGLGLTLAALLETFAKSPAVVFATGEIQLPQTPGQLGIVEIAAVDGIRGKLSLIGDYLMQHQAQLTGQSVHVLLPKLGVTGQPLLVSESRALVRLKDAATSAGLTLDLHFIDNLDQIEDVFGSFSAEPLVSPRRGAITAALLAGFAALALGWSQLVHAPVNLTWLRADGSSGPEVTPDRARYNAATDKLEILPACYDEQRQPVFVGGESLLLRVAATDSLPFASSMAPPRFFIASVSREADAVILDAALFKTTGAQVVPGSLTEAVAVIPIESTDDEIRLFVVATRDQTVSLSQLTEDLRNRLKGLDGTAVLTTSAQFLSDRFDGQIDYQFKVTTDATRCP